jgi:glutaredoxin
MDKIVMYSTGCPQCLVLKKKLEANGVAFTEVTDRERMIELGFTTVPVLEVDGQRMGFFEAVKWVNERRVVG